jgi:hypothetical protein
MHTVEPPIRDWVITKLRASLQQRFPGIGAGSSSPRRKVGAVRTKKIVLGHVKSKA